MSDQMEHMEVFIDSLSNLPNDDQTREAFRQLLRHQFEKGLPEAVERIWELPILFVGKPNEEYLSLLREARQLYLCGHFYSCVAMCGIVGERLIKDVFRASVLVQKDGGTQSPGDAAFDQFEHVEVSGIVNFLKKAGLLITEAVTAARDLGILRNRYAHARGEEPKNDALKAIKLLHALVNGTVSVMNEYEIRNGALVRKVNIPENNNK